MKQDSYCCLLRLLPLHMSLPLSQECVGSKEDGTSPKQLCFIAFLPDILDSKAAGRNGYISVLKQLAEKYKGSSFSYLWASAGQQAALEVRRACRVACGLGRLTGGAVRVYNAMFFPVASCHFKAACCSLPAEQLWRGRLWLPCTCCIQAIQQEVLHRQGRFRGGTRSGGEAQVEGHLYWQGRAGFSLFHVLPFPSVVPSSLSVSAAVASLFPTSTVTWPASRPPPPG